MNFSNKNNITLGVVFGCIHICNNVLNFEYTVVRKFKINFIYFASSIHKTI